MMILKRICLAALVLSLGVAGTAQAAQYSLAAGSGAQLHIGGGLALPIQPSVTVVGGVFPPLMIPAVTGVTVVGTTAMASGQQITVPANALHKTAAQQTVGLFTSNQTLYAVATNLSYDWPTAPAVFSVNGRTGPATLLLTGGAPQQTIRYSPRVVGKRFGGAAAFALTPGPAAGLVPAAPITIYAVALGTPGFPPCTHPAFGGTNAACVGALLNAMATGVAAIGQPAGAIVTTPGGVGGLPPQPGIVVGKFGATPIGTVSAAVFTPTGNPGGTNMATSFGYPFTTGKITLKAGNATGAPESFVISGNDTRTAGGAGTIQMVAGALSFRTISKENANRGWVRLVLVALPPVPAMSPLSTGIMIVLMLMVPTVYFIRRASNQTA